MCLKFGVLLGMIAVFPDIFGAHITNLNETCFHCMCYVRGCDFNRGCSDGYCGPFRISRVYWADADKPTLLEDEPIRREAFEDCAKDYPCSLKIIENYISKFAKDCNGDGVTDCYDYVMINHNGGPACSAPLELTDSGKKLLTRYKQCRL